MEATGTVVVVPPLGASPGITSNCPPRAAQAVGMLAPMLKSLVSRKLGQWEFGAKSTNSHWRLDRSLGLQLDYLCALTAGVCTSNGTAAYRVSASKMFQTILYASSSSVHLPVRCLKK